MSLTQQAVLGMDLLSLVNPKLLHSPSLTLLCQEVVRSQIPPTLPGSSCSPTLTQQSSSQLQFQPQTSSQSPHMPGVPAPAYNRQGLHSLVTETPPSFQFHQIVQSQNSPAPSFRQSVPTNHPAAGVLALLSSTQTPSPLLPPRDDVSPTDMATSTFSFPTSLQTEVFIVDENGNESVQQVVTQENNSKSKKQKTSKKVRSLHHNVFIQSFMDCRFQDEVDAGTNYYICSKFKAN